MDSSLIPADITHNNKCSDKNSVQRDVVDIAPSAFHVKYWDIFLLILSVVSHIIDVGFDVYLAYYYFTHNKDVLYFGLTVTFIILPAVVTTGFSVRWYISDRNGPSAISSPRWKWTMRLCILILQLAPILRYVDSLIYAFKARRAEKEKDKVKQQYFYKLMLKEDADAALLRVFECFLEAAPQTILQITILITESENKSEEDSFKAWLQMGSILSSLGSMAWALVSYHRTIRFAQDDKENISVKGTVMQFMWHFMMTVSRILAISFFATQYPLWAAVICLIHWVLMTCWLVLQQTNICPTPLEEILLCTILGIVYIFTYITVKDEKTRMKYVSYYLICFIENVVMVVTWTVVSEFRWWFYPTLVGDVLSFVLGISFMILYYKYYHPAGRHLNVVQKRDVCVQSNDASLEQVPVELNGQVRVISQ